MDFSHYIPRLLTRSYAIPSFLFIVLFINAIYMGYGWNSTLQAREAAIKHTEQEINRLRDNLDKILLYGSSTILHMQHGIRATKGELGAIYNQLRARVDEGQGIVRFAWSDEKGMLLAGSARGIHTPPYDISYRDYVQSAIANPHRLFVSEILPHVRTSGDIMVLAYGISTDKGDYLGTLSAVYYLDLLRHSVAAQMVNCQCDYRLLSPRGEVIASHGNGSALHSIAATEPLAESNSVPRFQVTGAVSKPVLKHIEQQSLLRHLGVLVLFNALVCGLLYWVRRHVVTPVESTLQAIAPYVGHSGISPQGARSFAEKLHSIRKLGEAFSAMREQLEQSEQHLRDANALVADLSQEQQRFFTASGSEMQLAHSAITEYSTHIEELVIERRIDADAPFDFDEVREMGENLNVLAESFHRICALKHGQMPLTRSPLLLRTQTDETLYRLHGAIERRNLRLEQHYESAGLIEQDEAILQQLLWALLFIAVRYSEDESTLQVRLVPLSSTTGSYQLSVDVSCYRQSILPPEQQDFSSLMPSRARDMRADIEASLMGHANVLIVQSYLALSDGKMNLHVGTDKSLRFDVIIKPLGGGNSVEMVMH